LMSQVIEMNQVIEIRRPGSARLWLG